MSLVIDKQIWVKAKFSFEKGIGIKTLTVPHMIIWLGICAQTFVE